MNRSSRHAHIRDRDAGGPTYPRLANNPHNPSLWVSLTVYDPDVYMVSPRLFPFRCFAMSLSWDDCIIFVRGCVVPLTWPGIMSSQTGRAGYEDAIVISLHGLSSPHSKDLGKGKIARAMHLFITSSRTVPRGVKRDGSRYAHQREVAMSPRYFNK
jgi:hypothetical protein